MEGLGQLVIFSIVMLVGSYGAGSAPLFMPLSEEKLHLVSVLGAGLLVGVAFAVIIPEGTLALLKAYTLREHKEHQHEESDSESGDEGHTLEGMDRLMGMSLVLGFIFMMFVDQLASSMSRSATTDVESLGSNTGTLCKRIYRLLAMFNFFRKEKRKLHCKLDNYSRPCGSRCCRRYSFRSCGSYQSVGRGDNCFSCYHAP